MTRSPQVTESEPSSPSLLRAPLALVGPTSAGKTELAVALAGRLDAEIVVVDSMTVYRGMDVGTAKPTPEQRAAVAHHLVDVADPAEPSSVEQFQALARRVLADLRRREVPALLVGGSGLYFRAVVDDLRFPGTDPHIRRTLEAEAAALGPHALHRRLASFDPAAAARIEPGNARRSVRALEVAALTGRSFSTYAADWDRYPPDRVAAAGLAPPARALSQRIEDRARRMLDLGLVEEVRGLVERGAGPFLTSSQAIGYLEVMEHLEGRITLDEVLARMVRRTRALARRQLAWFRRDPRIRWFETPTVDELEEHLRG
jgi:tRNA dimethylallyltransferase